MIKRFDNQNVTQQMLESVLKFAIIFDQTTGKANHASFAQNALINPFAAVDIVERQKRGAAKAFAFEKVDGVACGFLGFGDDVLRLAAERGFNRDDIIIRHAAKVGDHADDAWEAVHFFEHAFDAAKHAVCAFFLFLQHHQAGFGPRCLMANFIEFAVQPISLSDSCFASADVVVQLGVQFGGASNQCAER